MIPSLKSFLCPRCSQLGIRSFSTSRFLLKSHYDTLSLPRTATQKELKARFYQLSKKHHPDISKDNTKKFSEINEAYSVLREERSRREYDRSLPADRSDLMQGGMGHGRRAASGLSRRKTRPQGTSPSSPYRGTDYSTEQTSARNPFGFGTQAAESGAGVRNQHFTYEEHLDRHTNFDARYRVRKDEAAARRSSEGKDDWLARFIGISVVLLMIVLVGSGIEKIRAEVREEVRREIEEVERGESKKVREITWEEAMMARRKGVQVKMFRSNDE